MDTVEEVLDELLALLASTNLIDAAHLTALRAKLAGEEADDASDSDDDSDDKE
jgi:hypothetical protein